jgi:hypothetical protein
MFIYSINKIKEVGERVCNLARPKRGEKVFLISSALVYVILKNWRKLKINVRKKQSES